MMKASFDDDDDEALCLSVDVNQNVDSMMCAHALPPTGLNTSNSPGRYGEKGGGGSDDTHSADAEARRRSGDFGSP